CPPRGAGSEGADSFRHPEVALLARRRRGRQPSLRAHHRQGRGAQHPRHRPQVPRLRRGAGGLEERLEAHPHRLHHHRTGEPMTPTPQLPAADGTTDPHAWLEDVTGEKALDWVRERNAAAETELDAVADPAAGATGQGGEGLAATLQREILESLNPKDRIPVVTNRGKHLYNLWTVAEHERGLWRRTTLDSYRTEEPEWEVLLDVDALNEAEGENWVWHGARLLRPVGAAEGEPYRRALIALSRGGSDADVTREFDLETLTFVPESEGGFVRPEAKGSLSWIDEDTVWVCTDFGEDTMTSSGYARQARIWRRGTPLHEAELVHEVAATDMAVFAAHDSTPGWERDWIIEAHAFYDQTVHVVD